MSSHMSLTSQLKFLWIYVQSGSPESYGSTIFIFFKTSILFPIVAAPICILPIVCKGFLFSISSSTPILKKKESNSHPRYEVIAHCGCDFHFSEEQRYCTSCHIPIGHLYVLFREMSIQGLCLLFIQIIFFLGSSLPPSFYHFSLSLSLSLLFFLPTCY